MDDVKCPSVALEAVRYDARTGLVPVVVQDADTNEVLMQAFANREALKRTLATSQAWFWSRSREEYWRKGATSGNTQEVVDVRLDCDGDAVLYRVRANGPACHTGQTSCFHRRIDALSGITAGGNSTTSDERTKTDELPDVTDATSAILDDVWETISSRDQNRPEGSYTTYLFTQGIDKISKKVGEEAVEAVIAAKNALTTDNGRKELALESADLLFHLLVLWKASNVLPSQVFEELRKRQSPQ